MPIYHDKARGRLRFEFDRRISGQRVRATKLLPRAWNRAQADAFDRKECARLYAIATGVERHTVNIDDAVSRFVVERIPALKAGRDMAGELALMLPYYEARPMSALPDVCTAYRLKHKHLAAATIAKRIRYLVSACRWAWKHHGIGEHDPAERVVVPTVNNARQIYIDRAQMLKLARAATHRPTRALIRLAFYSGMRKDEIVRARPDLVAGVFILDDTKNGSPRLVPIHPKIRHLLPFAYSTHCPLAFRQARERAGMPWMHLHDLRHSAASAMLAAGASLGDIGAVLGHKSVASTTRYAHLSVDAARAAIAKIGRRA